MEVLSGVASGMAVVSLTVQLLQSANAIKTFIRDVKSASKELERLSDQLECLSALLTNVHDVVKRQTSLQHCPLPSPTISDCLKSCQSSFGLLEDIAKKHDRRQGSGASAMRKLKDDIRFGFKTQDITAIEARIQRDINGLNTALGTNMTHIQLTTLSVLLRFEQSSLTSTSTPQGDQNWTTAPSRTTNNAIRQHSTSLVSSQYGISTKVRQQWISSSLRRFGIHVRKSTRETSIAGNETNGIGRTSYGVTFASYEAVWRLLGWGIHWSRTYPYGNISPAFRVFPVVESMNIYTDLFDSGTCQEIQEGFRSGVLHPFTKDIYGFTTLHWAALAARPDVCRLLRQYGVKAELPTLGGTPLESFLVRYGYFSSGDVQIETLRTLILDFHTTDDADPSSKHMLFNPKKAYDIRGIETFEWLWIHARLVFHGIELLDIRVKLLYSIIHNSFGRSDDFDDKIYQVLVKVMDDEMVAEYLKGTYTLLWQFFGHSNSLDSRRRGEIYLSLLGSLHLDVEACVVRDFEYYCPGGLTIDPSGVDLRKRVIFEKDQMQSPILRWEWAYDPHALGYYVVSEFNALAGDTWDLWYELQWPFYEWRYRGYTYEARERLELNKSRRFDRRTNAKARKERARTGHKRVRSKMPGTWEW